MPALRQAFRQLRQAPLFTAVAVLTLALGIGANTAIFTLVQGILLRQLPVAHPSQLYRVGDTDDCCVNGGFVGNNGDFDIFSYTLYKTLQAAAAPDFTSLAAAQAGRPRWPVRQGTDMSASLQGELVSGNYFDTLGVRAFAGRMLQPADESVSAPAVAVVSYDAWQNAFGGDRHLVGSTLSIMSQPVTVVGIAPPGFFGDRINDSPPQLYLPLTAQPMLSGQSASDPTALINLPDSHWLYPIGRLSPGGSVAAAQARLSATLRHWLSGRDMYTRSGGAALIPKQHVTIVSAAGGIQTLQQQTGAGLKLLMILAGVVLLIACANIANMMLARGAAKRPEVALRMALGEGRGRLLRRQLVEGLLLGAFGGLAGLALAYAGARVIISLAFPDAVNSPIQATPTLVVLGFAALAAIVTSVLFALAPAWAAAHAQPAEVLRGASRTTRDRSSFSQKALIVFEVALAMVLLSGALVTARSLANVAHQDFGVATDHRYVVHFDPQGAGYTTARLPALYRQIEANFGAIPGVAHVGLGLYSPLEGDNWGECVIPEGQPQPGPNAHCGATWERVNADFLDSIGVPIVQGRGLSPSDTASSRQVAIVNQAFVKRFFPGQNPIGRHFGIDDVQYSGAFEIVGVFRDFKINNPRSPVRPVYLRPMNQPYAGFKEPELRSLTENSMFMNAMVVDFGRMPPAAPALLRQTMRSIDPNLIIGDLRTFDSQVAGNFTEDRLLAGLSSLFGVLALVLACIGLYGVTSYLVARRTGEIGVRMALGASRGRVVGLVLRGVGLQVAIGLAIGIPAAFFTLRLMASQMYEVGSSDPVLLSAGAGLLVLCSLLAGLLPARRAATIDPIRTLKAD